MAKSKKATKSVKDVQFIQCICDMASEKMERFTETFRWLVDWYKTSDAAIKELQTERDQLLKTPRGWICFHCGFQTLDEKKAEAHFGDRDDDPEFTPTCQWWQKIDDGERAKAYEDVLQDLSFERDENTKLLNQLDDMKTDYDQLREALAELHEAANVFVSGEHGPQSVVEFEKTLTKYDDVVAIPGSGEQAEHSNTRRLKKLESLVHAEGAFLLHNKGFGVDTKGFAGLGLLNRTLEEAIDALTAKDNHPNGITPERRIAQQAVEATILTPTEESDRA